MRQRPSQCACCNRQVALTFHHLIPRKLHRRTYFKNHFSRSELNAGIYICRRCHAGIHARHDEMTLGKHYRTLDALLADNALQQHFAWVGKQRERSR